MKESGINYFYNLLNFNTGVFDILYNFEENTGNIIHSVSGGNPLYSGILNTVENFWQVPNSGYSTGQFIQIQNSTGLFSNFWTKIFVFQKQTVNNCILFSNLNGTTGWQIGINDANKLYLNTWDNSTNQPACFTSLNNLSSKNVIAVSNKTNTLQISYYNFTSQNLETENFNMGFSLRESDDWKLLPSFTGYIDYFIYLGGYLSLAPLTQLCSGFQFNKTGVDYNIQTICSGQITGYQPYLVVETGITGYQFSVTDNAGIGDFTGVFPNGVDLVLTGIISTGTFLTGLTGLVCQNITGSATDLLSNNSGYALSFNMEKIQFTFPVDSGDIWKLGYEPAPNKDLYNKTSIFLSTGFIIESNYNSGQINAFYNGDAVNNDYFITGNTVRISDNDILDEFFYDLKYGDKYTINNTSSGAVLINIQYSGQEIYLNGINLISGYDYISTGNQIQIININTGITGFIFEYPIVLPSFTGYKSFITGISVPRYTSNLYLNGLRQKINEYYVEGAVYDRFSGNFFTFINNIAIYDNNDNFWN